ncbi:unnamed protein product [Ectocarpus sp. 13 AM-2016]
MQRTWIADRDQGLSFSAPGCRKACTARVAELPRLCCALVALLPCCTHRIPRFATTSLLMRSVRATVWLLILLSSFTICHSFVAQPKLGLALRWRDCCRSATCSVYSSSGSGSSGSGEVQATKKENGGSTASQESDIFEWLATNAGIRDKTVSLSVTAGGYRGLLADRDIAQGQASPAASSDHVAT